MAEPKVSVVMSVYNGGGYLRAAVDSILSQSFSNFEFVIVENASTDGSRDVIREYKDPRIRLVENPLNIGPPAALNKGLQLARGTYVARMDADDISLPGRLAAQVAFLDATPDCAVLGTQYKTIDAAGKSEFWSPVLPREDEEVLWKLMYTSPVCHSSVMMRSEVVKVIGGYDERLRHAADYALWSAVMARGHRIANLDVPYVLLRVHPTSDGVIADVSMLQREMAAVSRENARRFAGVDLPADDFEAMIRLLDWRSDCRSVAVDRGRSTLDDIAGALGARVSAFYGRALLRVAVAGRHVGVAPRARFFSRGIRSIISDRRHAGRVICQVAGIISHRLRITTRKGRPSACPSGR